MAKKANTQQTAVSVKTAPKPYVLIPCKSAYGNPYFLLDRSQSKHILDWTEFYQKLLAVGGQSLPTTRDGKPMSMFRGISEDHLVALLDAAIWGEVPAKKGKGKGKGKQTTATTTASPAPTITKEDIFKYMAEFMAQAMAGQGK